MKKRLLSLLLVLALSLCAVSAVAGEEPTGSAETENSETTLTEAGGVVLGDSIPSPAGPDRDLGIDLGETDPKLEKLLETVTIAPEALDAIAYADLERQMRQTGLTVLALQESITMIESIDYEDMAEDLRKQLNQIAEQQWAMISAPMPEINIPNDETGQSAILNGTLAGLQSASTATAVQSLDQMYGSLREQFDAIKDGKMQKDNIGVMRQVKNLQDQIILSGEMLYVTLAGLEIQETSLQRQLASLNRTVEEMELRYNMGQVSALQLSQTKAGQTSLASGLETLRMNIRSYKAQLEGLLGVERDGQLQLGPVPEVTEQQLAAMNVEQDLLKARAKSYDLYAAAKTLEDAQESYKEAGKKYGYTTDNLQFRQAKHNWQSAQYAYNNTIQEYDLKFRTLYAQVLDHRQIWNAARVSLETEKLDFAASELKYQQGTISLNTYLTAQDDLKTAEENVLTAAHDLFSSYNSYCWAVQHGILN